MKQLIRKIAAFSVLVSMVALGMGSVVSAHVVVRPAEVTTAGFQTFTVGVPNEKEIPTTSIKLVMPDGLKHVSPTQKSGWNIDIEKQGSGEDAVVTSVTWSGNEVRVGFRDEFTFSAQVPEKVTELQWKAYQTYADGTVVSWDKASEGDGHESDQPNSGPYSVTEVVTDTETAASIKASDAAAAGARDTANRALYIGTAGLLIALLSVFLATRKPQQ